MEDLRLSQLMFLSCDEVQIQLIVFTLWCDIDLAGQDQHLHNLADDSVAL